jgi:hypothetical protein
MEKFIWKRCRVFIYGVPSPPKFKFATHQTDKGKTNDKMTASWSYKLSTITTNITFIYMLDFCVLQLMSVWDAVKILPSSKPILSQYPVAMESFGQSHGFAVYRTQLKLKSRSSILHIPGVRDRATIFLNQVNRFLKVFNIFFLKYNFNSDVENDRYSKACDRHYLFYIIITCIFVF